MWTEQTVETLKRLALEGRSASWIAAALGAPSRSAVIGKASRIGVKLAGSRPRAAGETARPAPARGARPAAPRARRTGDVTAEPRPVPRPPARGRTAECGPAGRQVYAGATVGVMRQIGLAEIGDGDCRWPTGDPGSEGFAYCGLPAARGRAYCAGHCRLIYRTGTS